MIRVYCRGNQACLDTTGDPANWTLPADAIWVDLIHPTPEEDRAVERALHLSIPTREEMSELEASSRMYRENGATFVTADIMHAGTEDMPAVDPVTFVLTSGPLVTVRYVEPRSFVMLGDKLDRDPALCSTGADLFLHLMETIIDRTSEVLSSTSVSVEVISTHIFQDKKAVGFDKLIAKLGRAQMANARIDQSLSGLSRVFAFVSLDDMIENRGETTAHLKSLSRDALSLIGHNQAIAASINFQLSAALGLINIEQSSIIKIFSVAAVAFMPPTLIASIYGMNFEHMPELAWMAGYPMALAAMVVAAIAPLLWFRKKGWL
ncbi:magnesium transporter CorA family protein [Brevundimonas variabilis]|uniref:Magnesium transport protein CorA n=1 Tax=Brevundimonas variabilis TaxID=74312 RepID=A0A7W9CL21_9CAUL|nr:magnesium transporter CorA family protein [Brevundimonas variabilis]MBB5747351.1 magnesium transporter [Brevundimonas variabilis]